ncbi:Modulator of FtsH protease HflK [Phycisphaerales bacterium]|nr:Modulator of FtsH protease HflK [Phycisphaerales bacterium]
MNDRVLRSPDAEGGGAPEARRAGSVTLRSEGAGPDDAASMLDPANQSLAEALKVMLVLLQGAMLILGILYLLSGIGSVKENERGLRLLFGKPMGSEVEAGIQWTAPFPMGELVHVDQGGDVVEIDQEFWPSYQPGQESSADKLAPSASLKPGQGGSVLTADGNIAHTRWKVRYRVRDKDAVQYSRTILSDEKKVEEKKLVKAAAMRGIVHACAGVTIDKLLTQSGSQTGSVVAVAIRETQAVLDEVGSGLEIFQMGLDDLTPPLAVRKDFARVQSAVSAANKAVEEARSVAGQTLLGAAGQAAPYLIERIEAFEATTARRAAAEKAGDRAAVDAADKELAGILDMIDWILQGKPATLPGGTVLVAGSMTTIPPGEVRALAGGEVARSISDAASYRTSIVSRTQADFERFSAKLAQYEVNPKVMLQRELSDAVGVFLGRETVQQVFLPTNTTTLSLILNADPDIARAIQKAQKDRERLKAEEERMKLQRQDQYKTETGLTATPG